MYEKLKRDEEERKEKEKTKQLERLRSDMKAETSPRGQDSFCIQFMISYSVFMIFVCSFYVLCSLSAALRSNAADYVLRRFIYLFFIYFFIFYSPFVLRNYSTDSHKIFRNCVF